MPAGPRGEVEEPHGDPDDAPVLLGDVGEDPRDLGEEVRTQRFGRRLHGVGLALVVGQRRDQAQYVGFVAELGGPDRGGHARASRRLGRWAPLVILADDDRSSVRTTT